MADPRAFVPYNEPCENSCTDDIRNMLNAPDVAFANLSLIEEPYMHPASSSVPQSNVDVGGAEDPFNDPIVWDALSRLAGANSQAGPSQNYAETRIQQRPEDATYGNMWYQQGPGKENYGSMRYQQRPENENHGNMRSIPVWPVPPVPYLCSCCLVLREIIHTSATSRDTTKLEIHGRLGLICHAILEIRQSTSANQYQMFDFCKKSIEDVKNFLVQYCDERKQAGFFMLPDPLSFFYEALCVGLDRHDNLTVDDYNTQPPVANLDDYDIQPSMENSENYNTHPPVTNLDNYNTQQPVTNSSAEANEINQVAVVNEPERIPRTSLARQRMRTGKLSLKDFVQVFHLPIEVAARELRLCPTVVKKICRKYNLDRWPYRKIKSIRRKVKNLAPRLASNDAEERAAAQAQLDRLRNELHKACAGVIPKRLSTI